MKVLVAVDSSPTAETVVAQVALRPWPPDTTLCVLNVVDTRSFVNLTDTVKSLIAGKVGAAQQLVERCAEKLKEWDLNVTTRVVEGYPRKHVLEFAEEWDADFLFVGSLGRNPIGKFFLGSVSKAAAREARCSVEIVRPTAALQGGGMRILIAVDGSESSMLGVHSVANRPWPVGTELRVVGVAEPVGSAVEPWYGPAEITDSLEQESRAEAEATVAKAMKILAGTGLSVTSTAPMGFVNETILEEAQNWAADLIVLGTHGRHGINRILLGSVSDAVALHAHCSVEIIRQHRSGT